MCIPGYWIAGFHGFHAPRRLQYPMGWGTLGFAFPAALGASLAGTGPTVSISGDGGFLFACGELATMAQEQLPLTAVIVDDGGYGMLRYDQELAGDETYGVDLRTPDFAALAASFGIRARDRRRARRRVRRGARPARRRRRAERARRAGGGARPAAHDVAQLVPQARLEGTAGQLVHRALDLVERRLDHRAAAPTAARTSRGRRPPPPAARAPRRPPAGP